MTDPIISELKPPVPTLEKPLIQIDWVWNRFLRFYTNPKTLETYGSILNSYKQFIKEYAGYDDRLKNDPRFYLFVHWDQSALYNAEMYWREIGHKSKTLSSSIGCLTRVMNFAAAEKLTSVREFFPPRIKAVRETRAIEAYTDEKLNIIRQIVREGVGHAKRVAAGYVRTGSGEDPRHSKQLDSGKHSYCKWEDWKNVVWYFENVMNCDPKLAHWKKGQPYYPAIAVKYHGGIQKIFRKLGVSALIGFDIISPLIVKLAMETGLNPQSIYNLKRDCFQEEHQFSGLPCLKYYKERSKGEKELHLPLLDREAESSELLHENTEIFLPLLPKQSEIVSKTVKLIIKLTEPLVDFADEEDKKYLLLYESGRNCKGGKSKRVTRCSRMAVNRWCRNELKRFKKEVEDVDLFCFNLVRFRTTKITQMVREGYDFFRIQSVAGHSNILTTANYISENQIKPYAEKELYRVITKIHSNKIEYEQNPLPIAVSGTQHQPGVVYKGVMSNCKNVYDPPDSVKKLPTYKSGQTCTYWNMCLLCQNIIITLEHLPAIVSYANEIDDAFKSGNLLKVPNTAHYKKIQDVLREVFEECSDKHLAWAKEIAKCSDIYLDGVVYRGVNYEK